MRLGAIEVAVDFSITADTPSEPVDFVESREQSKSVICYSVQSRSEGQFSGFRGARFLRGGKE